MPEYKPIITDTMNEINLIDSRLSALEKRMEMLENQAPGRTAGHRPGRKVLECVDEFMDMQSGLCQWAEGTVRAFRVLRGHLEAFGAELEMDFFDREGLDRWLTWLRDKGLEESTVRKMYQLLRWFLLWAVKAGYVADEGIKDYRPKFKIVSKPVIYLNSEELARLYRLEIPADVPVGTAETLAAVRDGFCLCAFTSLRYSDLARLRKTDVDGDLLWITTQKTNDRLPIDLGVQAKEILARYRHRPGTKAIPVVSNQKMNIYIKVLCRLCGMDTPVTRVCFRHGRREEVTLPKWALVGTHAARRTFICYALESGIPPQVVMKWTGHADYKSMRPYIDIAQKTKADAMHRLSARWEAVL